MKEFELKKQGLIERLTNETFKFDSRIKEGWYTAVYFLKTSEIVKKNFPDSIVTMQFFQRSNSILCGVDEAIALLHTFATNPQDLKIYALNDGDKIEPNEPVMKVIGKYQDFGFLEGVIDGILARRTSVATNVYNVTKECLPANVLFMGDRDDHYSNQAGDGYSAYIGGVAAQCTHAMNEWWGQFGSGTMPHALIQMCDGDIVRACQLYLDSYPDDKLVALIDYNNDVIVDSLKVAAQFKEKLFAVRVDTSKAIIDKYFDDKRNLFSEDEIRGVNPHLIIALRKALDNKGYKYVKIIVSSGFDLEKIQLFKKFNTPVDTYGIGSSLLKVNIGFTGDLVQLNGHNQSKVGRINRENPKLKVVKYLK